MKRSHWLILLLAVLLPSMATHATDQPRRYSVGGVPHIVHPEGWRKAPVDLLLRRAIGQASGDDRYVFSSIGGVAVDQAGRLYVLDTMGYRVQVYRQDGSYLRTVGRQGAGPGELQGPQTVLLPGNGQVAVTDYLTNKMIFFDTLGTYLRELVLPPTSLPVSARMTADGDLLGQLGRYEVRDEAPWMGYAVSKVDPDSGVVLTTYLEKLSRFDPTTFDLLDNSISYALCPEERVLACALDDRRFVIQRFELDAAPSLVIKKTVKPVEKTEEEMAEERNRAETRRSMKGGAGAGVPYYPDPFRPIVVGLGVDSHGRIWAQLGTEARGNPPRFEVFTADGEYVGSVVVEGLTEQVRFEFWGDTVIGYDTDPDDFVKVYVLTVHG
jgi:hypothetical protein